MSRSILIVTFSLVFGCLPGPARAAEERVVCANAPLLEVLAVEVATAAPVCAAAGRAIEFLARFGIHPKRAIRFAFVDELIDQRGYSAYGSYDSRADLIRLMAYEAIQARVKAPRMYGEPLDRVHYAGAIAHEVAHAVVQHNLVAELLSPAPQEYLAHATQMAVLPETRRKRILAKLDVAPWESGDAISDVYFAIEPDRFAAKSYLHLSTLAEPRAFVEILLNAKWFYVYVP